MTNGDKFDYDKELTKLQKKWKFERRVEQFFLIMTLLGIVAFFYLLGIQLELW